ncbi:MAG: flagellar motor switch protein FliN [Phycisphaerae bacterium]|nr:flagellar motor switch protein FliN [Phycisphaerae bacterium]
MADQPGQSFSQDDIDKLLAGAGGAAAAAPGAASEPAAAAQPAATEISQDELDSIARQAEAAIEAISSAPVPSSPTTAMAGATASSGSNFSAAPRMIRGGGLPGPDTAPSAFSSPSFQPSALGEADDGAFDLLDDVELDIRIELGRTSMYVEDVLKLDVDAVIELDKLAGDPVDIYVNDQLIARGEVLVLNENFCVRINAILSPVPELSGDA